MKKAFLLALAALFLAAPALVLYSSMCASTSSMQAEHQQQLLNRMHNELQRQDILINPVVEIYRKFFTAMQDTRNDMYKRASSDNISPELLNFVTGLMMEISTMWDGGEAALLYRDQELYQHLTVKNGKPADSGPLAQMTMALRTLQHYISTMQDSGQPIAEISALLKNDLQLYFSPTILRLEGCGDKTERVIIREPDSYKLLMLLRLGNSLMLNFLIDLTHVDADAVARRKIDNWPHQEMGLMIFTSKSPERPLASHFFNDKPGLKDSIVNMFKNSDDRSISVKKDGYLILGTGNDPKKQHRTLIVARDLQPVKSRQMLILITLFAIAGCFIFKILAEKLIFGRGSDFSLKMFIVSMFILVTLLPMLSSAYLTNEFVTANFKKEKNRVVKELGDKLLSLDLQTLAAYRASLNQIKNLDSIEKIAEFTEKPVESSLRELSMAVLKKLHKNNGLVRFTEVWVYDEGKEFFSVKPDGPDGAYRFAESTNFMLEELFLPKYREYLQQQRPYFKSDAGHQKPPVLELDSLKAEILDSYFLNMFGAKTYYKIRENFGALIQQESFMDSNSILTVPITHAGHARYVFSWTFDSVAIRNHFPYQHLDLDASNPLFVIYGNDQQVGAKPRNLNFLNQHYPTLTQLGNQSLISGSGAFMQNYLASGSPIYQARPARYSDYVLCGSRPTRDLESINSELVAEALKYFAAIALTGMLLALLTSMYFTIPIRQLTDATQQITNGNYGIRLDPRHPDEFALAASTFNKMATGLQEGQLLSSFVSESVKELAAREHLTSEDFAQTCRATVLFSSIKDFHTLQHRHAPEKVFEILQAHLSAAVDAVARFGGEIDKMIEDKVMIVFDSYKHSDAEHVLAATEVAMAVKREMNKQYGLLTAAGMTTGEVVSGVMGASTVRLSKTVVGDTVNLAARLAAVAANLAEGGIVASDSCVKLLTSDYVPEKLPIKQVKGKTQAVEAFLIRCSVPNAIPAPIKNKY